MRPTFQTASEDLRQTSILHHQWTQIRNLSSLFRFVVSPLTPDHRAVEFFIRDKYEKRIYYSKNVTNGSSVCITSHSEQSLKKAKSLSSSTTSLLFIQRFCLFVCFSRKMLRKRERGSRTEGARCRPTAR